MTRLQIHKTADRLARQAGLSYGQSMMIAHSIDEALANSTFRAKFGTHGVALLQQAVRHLGKIEQTTQQV